MSKLTPWFHSTVKPVHVGVYEVHGPYGDGGWYAYWDGVRFGYRSCQGPREAFALRMRSTILPARCAWRGLREPANG